jgi:hypothetical protein
MVDNTGMFAVYPGVPLPIPKALSAARDGYSAGRCQSESDVSSGGWAQIEEAARTVAKLTLTISLLESCVRSTGIGEAATTAAAASNADGSRRSWFGSADCGATWSALEGNGVATAR